MDDTAKFKILILAPFFSHEAIANRPQIVSEVLSQFGAVDIVTTRFDHQKKNVKEKLQFSDNRTIYYLPTIPYAHNISISRFLSHAVFSAYAYLHYLRRKDEYDVVYATLPLNLLAMLVFTFAPKKLKIIDVVDIWPDVLPFTRLWRKILWPFLYIWKLSFVFSVRNCDLLLTVSDRFLDESLRYFRRAPFAAQRVYIGCKRLTRKVQRSDNCLTIVYIGNIGHLYDFETILAAMAANTDRVRFFLVGDGDRRNWLLRELETLHLDYHFWGTVYDDKQLSDILSECHVGFNGYKNTTAAFSYKAITYFSAGLPILNSMSGDMEHLVVKHGLGINYTPGDIDSLLAGIKSISQALKEFSQNVDRFFNSEIEQKKIKERLTQFLGSFMAGGK